MATTKINAFQQLGSSVDWSASGGGPDVIIKNVKNPVNGTDAANKDYVDAVASGLTIKNSVRVGSTTNIILSGLQTIDGIGVSTGDRVLIKNQTTPSQNGIYTAAIGSWARATDANSNIDVINGIFTFIEEGTTQADSGWVLSTDGNIVLDTTALTFVQFSGSGQIVTGAGLDKTGTTIFIGTVDPTRIVVNADTIDLGQPIIGSSAAAQIQKLDFDLYGRILQKTNAGLPDIITTVGNVITQYTVFAGPSGTATGPASFRLLLATDIPTLDTSKFTTGTLGVARGGTGVNGIPTNGQLLIGNGTTYIPANITIGSTNSIIINNGSGTISLDVNAAAGAVTTAWAGITTGSITIGGGLTSGIISLGTATSTTTITGTIKFPTVGVTGLVRLGAGGILSADNNVYIIANKQIFRDSLSTTANPTIKSVVVWNNVVGSVGNVVYIWGTSPIIIGSECIFINGILQTNGNDYTISGLAVTFLTGAIPQTGDLVQVNYILT